MKVPIILQNQKRFKTITAKETIKDTNFINDTLKVGQIIDASKATDFRAKADQITHKIFGYVIFFGILLVIFNFI
jgi:ferrous iron transport protein B